jgi:hypothetical protein
MAECVFRKVHDGEVYLNPRFPHRHDFERTPDGPRPALGVPEDEARCRREFCDLKTIRPTPGLRSNARTVSFPSRNPT